MNENKETSMEEAQKLLASWGLIQLSDAFKEHEICLLALRYLTESDICELISKIGPRSIFRQRLKEWRNRNIRQLLERRLATVKKPTTTSTTTNTQTSNSVLDSTASKKARLDEPLDIKEEPTMFDEDIAENWLRNLHEQNDVTGSDLLEVTAHSPPSQVEDESHNGSELSSNMRRRLTTASRDTNIENVELEEMEELTKRFNRRYNGSKQFLNIRDVLENNFDGRKAFTFYEMNTTLDSNHRRKIVNVIICAAIECKIPMNVDLFHDIALQIVKLFPNECHDTYFIPREGCGNPKGALYNRFLNLSRQLRKDGLMEYRNAKRNSNSGS